MSSVPERLNFQILVPLFSFDEPVLPVLSLRVWGVFSQPFSRLTSQLHQRLELNSQALCLRLVSP